MNKLKKEFEEFWANLEGTTVFGESTSGIGYWEDEKMWKWIQTAISKAYKKGKDDGIEAVYKQYKING